METLHSLLHSLGKQQLKVLKKYLVSFSTRNENESKTWELAAFLMKSEKHVPTLDECSIKIYQCSKDSRIEKLKSRLQNKIFDSLMIDINVERKGSFDERDHMIIKVMKKSALYQTLRLSTRNQDALRHIQDEIITLSKKYEVYGILVDNLKHRKWAQGWRQGFNAFNKINEEITFYEYCSLAVSRATDNYYKMLMHVNFEGKHDEKKVQIFLKSFIDDMKQDYAHTKSAVVGYYLKMIEMAYYQNENDFSSAKSVCEGLLLILKNNPSVYRKSRLGACYDNIAECDLHLGNYEAAVRNTGAAQSFFPPKSSDYFLSKGLEFSALFYSGQLTAARDASQILLNSTAAREGDFRVAKYMFYNACVQFRLRNFKDCIRILSLKFEISKDKLGWEIAVRVLKIMTLIEMDKLDEVQQTVVSLQKHIERNAHKGDVHERDRMILRLLQLLDKEGFRTNMHSTELDKLLNLLAEKGKAYSWQPLSPELIPLHDWIRGKFNITASESVKPKRTRKLA